MRIIGSIIGLGVTLGAIGVANLIEQRDKARSERDQAREDREKLHATLATVAEKLEQAASHKPSATDFTEQQIAEFVVDKLSEIVERERQQRLNEQRREKIHAEKNRLFAEASKFASEKRP